ncbi:hypothetical protein BMS3Abin12_00963 [bacterium BMS3Abin12]|nr:hypothetical protein BMS3Abin12_00963 [bacterium BMS3Abin12]
MADDDNSPPPALVLDPLGWIIAGERRKAALEELEAVLERCAKRYPKLAPEKIDGLRDDLLRVADEVYRDELLRLSRTAVEFWTYADYGEVGRDIAVIAEVLKHGGNWRNATWEGLDRAGKARVRLHMGAHSFHRGGPAFRYPLLVRDLASIICTMIGLRSLPISRPNLKDPTRTGKLSGPAFNALMGALRYACFSGDPPSPETVVKLLRNHCSD